MGRTWFLSTHLAKWVDKNHQVIVECNHGLLMDKILNKKVLTMLLIFLSVHLAKWVDKNHLVAVE